MSNSQYSHVMLLVGKTMVVHATLDGVHSENVQRLLFDRNTDAVVLRMCESLSAEQAHIIGSHVQYLIGTGYSKGEAKRSLDSGNCPSEAQLKNRQFCTRLIAQAYAQVGLRIVETPDYCTPEQLLDSPALRPVKGALRPALETEVAFAESPSPIDRQIEVTKAILIKARKATGADIQTLQQLGQYIVDHPGSDEELLTIVEESGYLAMWEWDIRKNPWNYEYDEFLKQYSPDVRMQAAEELLVSAKELLRRFHPNLEVSWQIYQKTKLNYFRAMVDLYTKLVDQENKRLMTAFRALKNYREGKTDAEDFH